jgi:cbb3-type cytochrome oxidase maturation protein
MVYLAIWIIVLMFGLSAVVGLVWSIRSGQMRDLERGALVIFDSDEPVGQMTDHFPSSGSGLARDTSPRGEP